MTAEAMAERAAVLYETHRAAGAGFGAGSGDRLPAWYGEDPVRAATAEHTAARQGAALVDLAERGLLTATGPQRQKFLHSILSNDVELPAGSGRRHVLLDLRGHVQALLRASVGAKEVQLELPAARIELVEQTLLHYRVAAPVRFARPGELVLGIVGPQAPALLEGSGAELPAEELEAHRETSLAGTRVRLIRAGDLPGKGLVLHVEREGAAAVWSALVAAGAVPLGRRALDALRIEEGRAWYGSDLSEQNLLHETGLLAELHSFSKGCYLGQEVVARLEGRGGHVSRQLRGLRLEEPVEPGAAIEAEGKGVGRVTSAGVSPALGAIAMGYVHRSAFQAGTRVSVAGRPAEVAELPLLKDEAAG